MTWLAAALTAATLDGGTHKRVGVKLHIISCLFKSYIPLSYVNRATIRNVCMRVFSRENLVSTSLCVCVCYRSVSRMITEVCFSHSSPRLLKKTLKLLLSRFLTLCDIKKKVRYPEAFYTPVHAPLPRHPLFSPCFHSCRQCMWHHITCTSHLTFIILSYPPSFVGNDRSQKALPNSTHPEHKPHTHTHPRHTVSDLSRSLLLTTIDSNQTFPPAQNHCHTLEAPGAGSAPLLCNTELTQRQPFSCLLL